MKDLFKEPKFAGLHERITKGEATEEEVLKEMREMEERDEADEEWAGFSLNLITNILKYFLESLRQEYQLVKDEQSKRNYKSQKSERLFTEKFKKK